MPYSICPHCGQKSYSAATFTIWKCPYCGKEINEEKSVKEKKYEETRESS